MRTLILLSLVACSGDDADTASAAAAGPYLSDDIDVEVPGFDAASVADAVNGALGVALEINASPVVSIYDAFMDATTDACPQWYTSEGSPYWFDACTTEDGVTFDGYGLFAEYDGVTDTDGTTYYGYQIYGVGTLSAPDGATLTLTGQADLLYATAGTIEAFYTNLTDGTSWDGESTGTWLDWGINPGMYMNAIRETTSGARTVQLSGTVAIDDGSVDTVVFDNLYLVEDPSGALCGDEPSGMISILSSDGQWYDLVFDGPTEDNQPVPDEVCDGCATAWFKGEALGEACVDFSPLMAWEDNPWGL